ncbi:MAG: aromatic ring-hydroxylating dioxygenase subunit alpha [Candidatus Binatus sp.]|uniref:aromatic ring-hydroxylating oxygenase subunit alpha n=1 Tax=Candidatus Binatus sp. TaxID=2811406 RepID=UPI002725848F|nr:aromatic ring-hydroxylating dioxygenase subunit alpha [Candidatus Binatus sp.]MDO8430900.1 aromatic ring-hydroxylating dioxygenase subunit alpha [Candidatus Binatus sp.]
MTPNDFIPDQWYPILDSETLRRRRPVGVKRLGERLVLWRDSGGNAVCATDRCPHRGVQLSLGRVCDGQLECPYHGLRFNAGGECVMIPANGDDAPVPRGFDLISRVVREGHGLIWCWYGDPALATDAIPWFVEAPDPGPRTGWIADDYPVSYLRVMENFGDLHHVPFVHRATIPGAGTRAEVEEARLDGDVVRLKVTLRHQRPRRLKIAYSFATAIRLPALVSITFARRAHFVAAATPIDETHTWLWARYRQDYVPGWMGGRLIARLGARFDFRSVFSRQDMRMLASQQLDNSCDISHYHLLEADGAIALYFAIRKRAIEQAQSKAAAPSTLSAAH